MKLNEQITQLRRERKMSQEELAEILQVSRQSVSKWENGLSNPDTENLIRLAEIFQVDVNLLIGSQLEAEEKPTQPIPPTAPDQRKTVHLLSVLLALAVLSTLIFGALWGFERTGVCLQDMFSTRAKEKMWWDTVQMHAGLLGEEIQLTSDEKKEILDYINCADFQKWAPTEQDEEIVYGGKRYVIDYQRAGVLLHWVFTEQGISCKITMHDGMELNHRYIENVALLNMLGAYVSNNS